MAVIFNEVAPVRRARAHIGYSIKAHNGDVQIQFTLFDGELVELIVPAELLSEICVDMHKKELATNEYDGILMWQGNKFLSFERPLSYQE